MQLKHLPSISIPSDRGHWVSSSNSEFIHQGDDYVPGSISKVFPFLFLSKFFLALILHFDSLTQQIYIASFINVNECVGHLYSG